MLKNVICPDGEKVLAADCLAGKCPHPTRCRPLSYIRVCLSERPWTGTPSVTQLINGSRFAFLKIRKDYDEKIGAGVFKVLGTSVHAALDEEDGFSFTEEKFTHEEIAGTADRIEVQPNGEMWLIDHKVVGSYKISKALGMVKTREKIVDVNGNPEYYKSGAKKGQQKEKWVYVLDITQADRKDWTLQLNYYRIMIEEQTGFKIARLKIHAIVRDGDTMAARQRMVTEKDYYFDIDILPNDTIMAYFRFKKERLLSALENNIVPPPCTAEECWEGRKCANPDYCPVRDDCLSLGDNPWIGKDTDDEEQA